MAEVWAAAHLAAPVTTISSAPVRAKPIWGSGKLLQNLKSSQGPWELKSTVGMPLQEQCQAEHHCLGAACTGFAFWSISGNFPDSGGSAVEGSITTAFCRATFILHLRSPEVLTEGHLV